MRGGTPRPALVCTHSFLHLAEFLKLGPQHAVIRGPGQTADASISILISLMIDDNIRKVKNSPNEEFRHCILVGTP